MLRFRDLTENEVQEISDGCGIVAKGLRVPDFIFKARCDQHDFYTMRGTGWSWNSHWFLPYSLIRWYLQGEYFIQKANIQFLYWMLVDAWSNENQFLEKIIYTKISFMYWLGVSLWALIPKARVFTEWRTKDELLTYAKLLQNG